MIKKDLQKTIHSCSDMGLYNTIMIESTRIWLLKQTHMFDSLYGEKKDWKMCPYCGMKFYDDEGEVKS